MNVNIVENSGFSTAGRAPESSPPDASSLRRAAMQFEAILLMQLTSSLRGTDDDEDSLFGGDSGSGLARQMFSEQLATTMAESGGIGLADLILQQFGGERPKTASSPDLANLISAVKKIRGNEADPNLLPVPDTFAGDPNDAQVISLYQEEFGPDAVDGLIRPAGVDGTAPVEKMSFQMPVSGRISSGFGNRFHPIDKKIKFHAGIDIAAPKGTAIGAAAEGVVVFAGWRKGYGNLVIVQHPDGRETFYGHASKIFAAKGDQVVAGQKIAEVGSTGKSTGPHLHFEVREDGQPVDPKRFLSNVLKK